MGVLGFWGLGGLGFRVGGLGVLGLGLGGKGSLRVRAISSCTYLHIYIYIYKLTYKTCKVTKKMSMHTRNDINPDRTKDN